MTGHRPLPVFLALGAALLCVFAASLQFGTVSCGPLECIRALLGQGSERESMLLLDYRLPRALVALGIGVASSISGVLLQSALQNDLAGPDTMGLNAGAGLAVFALLASFPRDTAFPQTLLCATAWGGAGTAALVIGTLAWRASALTPIQILLAGVAVHAALGTITYLVAYLSSSRLQDRVIVWQTGALAGASWSQAITLLAWVITLFPFVLARARRADILLLSEETAQALGVPVARERATFLALAAGFGGAAAAAGGSLAFVGVIGPHIARKLVGARHSRLFPAAALVGAVLVLGADTVARVTASPAELPTGLIVSAVGAPYFLYLLSRS